MSKPKNMTPEQEAAWKESTAARQRTYREANRVKLSASARAYQAANREKERARKKAYLAASRKKLTAGYVSNVLKLKVSEIPPELLELKRNQLLIHRALKQMKQTINGEAS
jgi:hypothetical protein